MSDRQSTALALQGLLSMDHRPALQWHHADLQGQPMPFDQECHGKPHVQDTKENHDLVLRKLVLSVTAPKWQDHNGALTVQPILLTCMEVLHKRLAESVQRLLAHQSILAGCLAVVCGDYCS